ncbi:MAG: 3-hydroxyacyl-CoA dehydrogenase NAD-binding domain-containing protein [Oryzomonas sp.]|jgi:3-hydroxyacyl-CoA dehydrogenase/enoyl-CoA hydratase/3-hydroxybutyryl-CoA epimerase
MKSDITSYCHWRFEQDQAGTATLTLDRADSSTNSLSREVLGELEQLLSGIDGQTARAVVIRSGKRSGFIAGADVNEFTGIRTGEEALQLVQRGQAILALIEALPVPSIALIHGFCLGGGLELALACRYRIASDDPGTRLGFPEILLGIHPGFGGTLRATRLVGPLSALGMMLTGRTLSARQALKIGLVDYVVPERHLDNALHALLAAPSGPGRLPLAERLAALSPARAIVAHLLRRRAAGKADPRHYPAPYALIDLWHGFGRDATANYAAEAQSVARLITGSSSRNLVRVFQLQERLKAQGKVDGDRPQSVHVVGGGVMGGDIAIWCAMQGLRVTIQDVDTDRIGQVVKRAQALFSRLLKERRAVEAALDRLVPDPAGHGAARADLVIEAIFEDANAKRELYRQMESSMRPDAILASNTSSIPLEELAGVLSRPERLVGLHFFNPVDKMQLVEVVAMATSDAAALARAAALVLAIKRLPLPVRSSPGFLVNRILMPYLLEAVTLVEEGVTPSLIDLAATDFGMPMGPVRLADAVGLDVCLSVAKVFSRHYATEVPARLEQLVATGRLGRKSGSGFYEYHTHRDRKTAGGTNRPPAEIGDRIMLRLLNEAVACWREQVVEDAELLDGGVIFGSGFAPFRGGPMRYIATAGPEALYARLRELSQRHGTRFTPDEGWQELIKQEG